MAIKPGVNVRKLGKPQRGYRWLATFRQGERRARKYFGTKAEAEEWSRRSDSEGATQLTTQERGAVLDTRAAVEESGFTLRQVVELGLERTHQLKRKGRVDELLEKRLAKLAGVDPKTVAFVEKRQRNPTLYTLLLLAGAMEADLGEIVMDALQHEK